MTLTYPRLEKWISFCLDYQMSGRVLTYLHVFTYQGWNNMHENYDQDLRNKGEESYKGNYINKSEFVVYFCH